MYISLLLGNILVVSEATEDKDLIQQRKQMWGNLSDMAREQFYWSDPSVIYTETTPTTLKNNIPSGGRDENKILLPPPGTFLLLILIPEKVKYLRLKDNYAQFDELINNEWMSNRVNP